MTLLSRPSFRVLFPVLALCLSLEVAKVPPALGQPLDFRAPVISTFNPSALLRGRIGGVISQVERLVDTTGNPTSVTVELPPDEIYPGYILLRLSGSPTPYRYHVDYADLLPMVLFARDEKTNLYTLWDDDQLPPEFRREEGFVDHRLRGLVALEFQGTQYADALYFLDTCQGCVMPADDALRSQVQSINDDLSGSNVVNIADAVRILEGTYINTDTNLTARTDTDGRLLLTSTILRLHPSLSGSGVEIEGAERVVSATELLDAIKRAQSTDAVQNVVDQLRERTQATIEEATDLDVQSAVGLTTVMEMALLQIQLGAAVAGDLPPDMLLHEALLEEEIAKVRFLFATLGLLRSARVSAPEEWATFARAVTSDAMRNANPEPWDRYYESYCSVYTEADGCASR
ncbi:MAG: hypothetical protein OXQ29_16475 [Rhodospirillaceae bacterium]|nr:hypothetical protein [Rhodospirillaceae bacterium]